MTELALPPGPRHLLPVTSGLSMLFKPLPYLEKLAGLGDIVHFMLRGQHAFLFNHPDHVQEILVTKDRSFMKGPLIQQMKMLFGEGLLSSEGTVHQRQRRLVQPAFHRQRMDAYAQTMIETAERFGSAWEDGQTIDVTQQMMRLTLEVVARALFGSSVEEESKAVSDAVNELIRHLRWVMTPAGPIIRRLRLPTLRRAEESAKRLDAVIYRMIEERRRSGEDRGDLLSMLLLSRNEEGSGGMTDQQVRDEAMTIFVAGHETTANALMWSWLLLSENSQGDAQLAEELERVLGGNVPRTDQLPQLAYTGMVIAESMRLYPPAWALARTALEDVEIGGCRIPRGSTVFVAQWLLHRDERFWDDPLRFDPLRFSSEAKTARRRFIYFPFGAGSRMCIGDSFAMVEATLVMATLARRWRLRMVPGQRIELQPLVTLRSKNGIRMVVEKR